MPCPKQLLQAHTTYAANLPAERCASANLEIDPDRGTHLASLHMRPSTVSPASQVTKHVIEQTARRAYSASERLLYTFEALLLLLTACITACDYHNLSLHNTEQFKMSTYHGLIFAVFDRVGLDNRVSHLDDACLSITDVAYC